jgi:hypothetical protein
MLQVTSDGEVIEQPPHVPPPNPHLVSFCSAKRTHWFPLQHPSAQVVASQTQLPPTQCCPEVQAVVQLPQ